MTNLADRTIWTGDHLDILRRLNSASVGLIYLDPPSNFNRTYAAPMRSVAAGAAFKDTWTLYKGMYARLSHTLSLTANNLLRSLRDHDFVSGNQ